jgi:hypothetical protein
VKHVLAEGISLFDVRFHRGRSPLTEEWARMHSGFVRTRVVVAQSSKPISREQMETH